MFFSIGFLGFLLPALVVGSCCPGLVPHKEPYHDVNFTTLKDARFQIRPCILKELVEEARLHFDKYRGFVLTPDPWDSYTCHIPNDGRMYENWSLYNTALETSLREIYNDRFLRPVCMGGYWPAYGGLADFSCTWALPCGYAWNSSFDPRHCQKEIMTFNMVF